LKLPIGAVVANFFHIANFLTKGVLLVFFGKILYNKYI